MSSSHAEGAAPDQFYAQTYDARVSDWPGELDFYRALAAEATARGHAVLELACGTGRVAIRLAESGARVTGLDRSPLMLDIAREKGCRLENLAWVEADMRDFDLAERSGLVIVPGHSFQNLLAPEDQLAALRAIRRHLLPDGTLVLHLDHLDFDWLGELVGSKGGVLEPAEEFMHPTTGLRVCTSRAWSYEPATQTAIASTVWEEIRMDGVRRVERGPTQYHCFFPCEVHHLLALSGFEVCAVYGDFHRAPLEDSSDDMIWVAKRLVRSQGTDDGLG
jgi:SAM-dependent methyltransferase